MNSDKGYILELNVEYPKNIFHIHGDLPFLAERKKIKKSNKLVCNIHDSKSYVVHTIALKQALNNGLTLKKYIECYKFPKTYLKRSRVRIQQSGTHSRSAK